MSPFGTWPRNASNLADESATIPVPRRLGEDCPHVRPQLAVVAASTILRPEVESGRMKAVLGLLRTDTRPSSRE